MSLKKFAMGFGIVEIVIIIIGLIFIINLLINK
jgi:hypothetical protein